MGKIIVLDEDTANRIAAGEVVERPASIVKELVENSLDAGARNISIDIRKGGIASITVSDDGEGFYDDDVLLAFERYATSKLRSAEDLEHVETLGFRGEALPSIASVSKVRLLTRRRGSDYGRLVEIHGGRLVRDEAAGCPYGTSISVTDLFYNLPARYKFLKKDAAEAAQISELVGRLAVGRPDISFTLTTQSAQVLHTQGGGDPEDAIFAVFGKETLMGLARMGAGPAAEPTVGPAAGLTAGPLMGQSASSAAGQSAGHLVGQAHYSISGYLGKPGAARANRNYQLFYVNGRLIRNRIIYAAVEEAYKSHMPSRRFPVVILYIAVVASLVDVNAHPAKTEVRFQSEGDLFRAVYHAVESGLRGMGAGAQVVAPEQAVLPGQTAQSAQAVPPGQTAAPEQAVLPGQTAQSAQAAPPAQTTQPTQAAPHLKTAQSVPPGQTAHSMPPAEYTAPEQMTVAAYAPVYAIMPALMYNKEPEYEPEPVTKPLSAAPAPDTAPALAAAPSPSTAAMALSAAPEPVAPPPAESQQAMAPSAPVGGALYIGQLFGTYLMFECGGSLVLIDQHAAHERMLFERIKKQYEKSAVSRQMLLESVTVSLLPDEMLFVRENRAFLEKAGFVFEEFGRDAVILREAPLYMERVDIKEFFLDALEIVRRDRRLGKGAGESAAANDHVLYQIACKAAVKGNRRLSHSEAEALMGALDALPKPLTCPHGRPLVVTMTKKELDKKFRRL
ncbi:MAG: DNA mismatch repair endonuclease MutL [Oscillospiraceae bacterium]|nr:DNA mismatch repair endonuclease MutL [Oscillospiraceae bacterium]